MFCTRTAFSLKLSCHDSESKLRSAGSLWSSATPPDASWVSRLSVPVVSALQRGDPTNALKPCNKKSPRHVQLCMQCNKAVKSKEPTSWCESRSAAATHSFEQQILLRIATARFICSNKSHAGSLLCGYVNPGTGFTDLQPQAP